MQELVEKQLNVVRDILDDVLSNRIIVSGNQRMFSEAEVLEFIYDQRKWAPCIRVLIMSFMNFAKTYKKFALLSLKFSIDAVLLYKDTNWAKCYTIFADINKVISDFLRNSIIEEKISLKTIIETQALLFAGNTAFYDKRTIDLIVVEAFLNVIDVYKGGYVEDLIKFIWIREGLIDKNVFLIKGLVFDELKQAKEGNYNALLFNESNLISRYTKYNGFSYRK